MPTRTGYYDTNQPLTPLSIDDYSQLSRRDQLDYVNANYGSPSNLPALRGGRNISGQSPEEQELWRHMRPDGGTWLGNAFSEAAPYALAAGLLAAGYSAFPAGGGAVGAAEGAGAAAGEAAAGSLGAAGGTAAGAGAAAGAALPEIVVTGTAAGSGLGAAGGAAAGGGLLASNAGNVSNLGNQWQTDFWGQQGSQIPGISGNVNTGTGIYGDFGGSVVAGEQGGLAGLLGGGGTGGWQDYAGAAQGLLGGGGGGQPVIVGAPAQNSGPNLVLLAQMQKNKRLQELRSKPNRTLEEEMEFRQLSKSGLLG